MNFSRRNFIKTGLIWVPSAALLQARAQVPPQVIADWQLAAQVAESYLLRENFEGDGYENSWSPTGSGTANPDFTDIVLEGSQSLNLVTSSQSIYTRHILSNPITSFDAYFLFRIITLGETTIANWRHAGGAIGNLAISASGQLRVHNGTAISSYTVDTMADNTLYHVWVSFAVGSGSNGTGSVGWSTNGARPTSGNTYRALTNGTATAEIVNFNLGNSVGAAANTVSYVFDKLRISSGSIGDNPS